VRGRRTRQTGRVTEPTREQGASIPGGKGEKLTAAEELARRLDRPMGILGVIFLFVVLGQLLADDPVLVTVLSVLGWVFWAVFVAEFVLRAVIAGFQREFWKKNWWQVVFLLVPFLRFFRALQALRYWRLARVARFGGVLTAGVRGSRSAGRLLSNRVGLLSAVTAIVILVSSQLLFLTEVYDSYADALYEAALLAISGTPLSADTGFTRLLEVVLSIYAVAVFATLAGALGAFFLEGDSASGADSEAESSPSSAVPDPREMTKD